MISRIESIAKNISEKLNNNNDHIKKQINYHINHIKELKENNLVNSSCIQYLLYVTCQFNMLNEMHQLLELNLYSDINQLLKPSKKHQAFAFCNEKTLLGLACYLGHIELVKYLVEVRLAKVNQQDSQGDTPLHHAVYGDSCNNMQNLQDKIAEYLLQHKADISIQNNQGKTPYDMTKWNSLNFVEKCIGRRLIDPASFYYDADKVRPLLQLAAKESKTNIFFIGPQDKSAKNFEEFCLEHAIELYVQEGKIGFGFSTLEDIAKKLEELSEKPGKKMSCFIAKQEEPYSSDLGLIGTQQLPGLIKKSVGFGIGASIITYYETQNILLSVGSGALSACLAFQYLSRGNAEKIDERHQVEKRIGKLQEHDRFFKAPQEFFFSQNAVSSEEAELKIGHTRIFA